MIGPETILVLVVLIIVGAFVVLVAGAVRSLQELLIQDKSLPETVLVVLMQVIPLGC